VQAARRGTYIRVLSAPQLFIEGNHRCGALLISYILVRENRPPFVVAPRSAQAFFDPSSPIKKIRKRGLIMQLRMPGLKQQFARLLKRECDPIHLLRPS
jgi:hypothetical protein